MSNFGNLEFNCGKNFFEGESKCIIEQSEGIVDEEKVEECKLGGSGGSTYPLSHVRSASQGPASGGKKLVSGFGECIRCPFHLSSSFAKDCKEHSNPFGKVTRAGFELEVAAGKFKAPEQGKGRIGDVEGSGWCTCPKLVNSSCPMTRSPTASKKDL